ncbi:hypothetical protein PybrP1_001648 [[Pythium] brassicae (nom. inval.)]|nr:hypothetical protein PybrP1_001648 [[Pythium] brassicae (nom. inval.)]
MEEQTFVPKISTNDYCPGDKKVTGGQRARAYTRVYYRDQADSNEGAGSGRQDRASRKAKRPAQAGAPRAKRATALRKTAPRVSEPEHKTFRAAGENRRGPSQTRQPYKPRNTLKRGSPENPS